MTISFTPRFGLPQWSAGTDTVSRTQFNSAFENIENNAAKDSQGTFASRPAFGEAGRYYYATDREVLYRDTGTAWSMVGGKVNDSLALASVPSAVAHTVQGAASQTADIFQIKDNGGAARSVFNNVGDFRSGGVYVASAANLNSSVRRNNAALSIHSLSTTAPSTVIRAIASQTSDLMQYQSASGSVVAGIDANGEARFRNFRVGTTAERNAYVSASVGTVFSDTDTESLWVRNTLGLWIGTAKADHGHSASDITSGTLADARMGTSTGTSGNTVAKRTSGGGLAATAFSVPLASGSSAELSRTQLTMGSSSGDTSYRATSINSAATVFTVNTASFSIYVGSGQAARFYTSGLLELTPYGSGTSHSTGQSPNMYLSNAGSVLRSTSSRRYKRNIQDAEVMDAILNVQPRTWLPKNGDSDRRIFGAIAEELHDLGLTALVDYDDEGRPDAIYYDRISVALIPIMKDFDNRLKNIEMALGLVP